MTTNWAEEGRAVLKKLDGLTVASENSIKDVALDAIKKIREEGETPEQWEKARKSMSREIRKVFPHRETKASCIESGCADCYYHEEKGRKTDPKWRHLVFKYLKLDSADYDAIGGEQRVEWKAQQAQQVEPRSEQPTRQNQLTLENMTIEQLGLVPEVTQTLEKALKQSGMDLTQFVQKAVEVYAKTITGKAEKHGEDLTMVSTQDLMTGDAYKTHPGRAKELTKRAIQAIKLYNSSSQIGDNADRWCITPSAIASLIGSKHKTIQSFIVGEKDEKGKWIEGDYAGEVKTHNQTYNLNGYSNRKPGKNIKETIDLAKLVPDGL